MTQVVAEIGYLVELTCYNCVKYVVTQSARVIAVTECLILLSLTFSNLLPALEFVALVFQYFVCISLYL